MRESLFEYCVRFDGRELWIGGYEPTVIQWYDRSGALEAISDLRDLEKRVFMDFVFGAVNSRSARRMARERENFTIIVELSASLFVEIRHLAVHSARSGLTRADETKLDRLLEPVFHAWVILTCSRISS